MRLLGRWNAQNKGLRYVLYRRKRLDPEPPNKTYQRRVIFTPRHSNFQLKHPPLFSFFLFTHLFTVHSSARLPLIFTFLPVLSSINFYTSSSSLTSSSLLVISFISNQFFSLFPLKFLFSLLMPPISWIRPLISSLPSFWPYNLSISLPSCFSTCSLYRNTFFLSFSLLSWSSIKQLLNSPLHSFFCSF